MKAENIKFKAKQLNSGKWFEGDLVHLGNRVCIGGDHIKDGITDVDPSTVCQFTGLKDCKGKELFEHDLIHFVGFSDAAEVIWSEGNCAFMVVCENKHSYWLHDVIKICRIERIGNKFDKEK